MKRLSVFYITLLLLNFCCRSETVLPDVGQGFITRGLYAPWDGKETDTRFCCHSTADRFFFSFEVTDSTLALKVPFTDEMDVCPEDRVEIFFSPDRELKKGYYGAEIDPMGRVLDYKAHYKRNFDYDWNFSTLETFGMITPWGYRMGGSIARSELENLGIDLNDGFWMGVYQADYRPDGSVIWYSLVPADVDYADFHIPGVMFECKATPKAEKRGVVVYPDDITSVGLAEWKKRIELGGLNVIGLHAATSNDPIDTLEAFVKSDIGRNFLALCEEMNVDVEYELHSLEALLPRELFGEHPEYFRTDSDGVRVADYNMCFSSAEAVEAMKPQLEKLLEWVKPTTHRYYFWADDKQGKFCSCPSCSLLSPSEQILLYENRLLALLREYDPQATLAHLAYQQTLSAPVQVQAADGIFLEYAPIKRDYSFPLSPEQIEALKGNALAFPSFSQHILEYWLDESMFCKWHKDTPVLLPFKEEQVSRDLGQYRSLGAADFTCFATWLNANYISSFGSTDSIFEGYGKSFKTNSNK